eukprot:CAMPEP_0177668638 /NCGR_PEP_ID=MMETSP0447-20121125/22904_1 /TAXON_ID=0 /ORGANISM="Stygamoeba regulata, Strain BSH-02190019" /LENGTH=96 /DNA_ID=CAMNT_0019175231 /DNA_START=96 /DNA_END=383 /DNA_ORIENTATION=-
MRPVQEANPVKLEGRFVCPGTGLPVHLPQVPPPVLTVEDGEWVTLRWTCPQCPDWWLQCQVNTAQPRHRGATLHGPGVPADVLLSQCEDSSEATVW